MTLAGAAGFVNFFMIMVCRHGRAKNRVRQGAGEHERTVWTSALQGKDGFSCKGDFIH